METLLVGIKNDKAKQLLKDLEDLDIIELHEIDNEDRKPAGKISDLKNMILSQMKEEEINLQLKEMRNEWQRNI